MWQWNSVKNDCVWRKKPQISKSTNKKTAKKEDGQYSVSLADQQSDQRDHVISVAQVYHLFKSKISSVTNVIV